MKNAKSMSAKEKLYAMASEIFKQNVAEPIADAGKMLLAGATRSGSPYAPGGMLNQEASLATPSKKIQLMIAARKMKGADDVIEKHLPATAYEKPVRVVSAISPFVLSRPWKSVANTGMDLFDRATIDGGIDAIRRKNMFSEPGMYEIQDALSDIERKELYDNTEYFFAHDIVGSLAKENAKSGGSIPKHGMEESFSQLFREDAKSLMHDKPLVESIKRTAKEDFPEAEITDGDVEDIIVDLINTNTPTNFDIERAHILRKLGITKQGEIW